MSEPNHELDLRYELTVLRGPVPPRDGVVKGGVIGTLLEDQKSARRVLWIIGGALLAGVGSLLTWVYLVGETRGTEKTEQRIMRREVDECLEYVRAAKKWQGTPPHVSPDP